MFQKLLINIILLQFIVKMMYYTSFTGKFNINKTFLRIDTMRKEWLVVVIILRNFSTAYRASVIDAMMRLECKGVEGSIDVNNENKDGGAHGLNVDVGLPG